MPGGFFFLLVPFNPDLYPRQFPLTFLTMLFFSIPESLRTGNRCFWRASHSRFSFPNTASFSRKGCNHFIELLQSVSLSLSFSVPLSLSLLLHLSLCLPSPAYMQGCLSFSLSSFAPVRVLSLIILGCTQHSQSHNRESYNREADKFKASIAKK